MDRAIVASGRRLDARRAGPLIDIVGDYAVITETGVGVPTIDPRVDYLCPARRGDLLAVGRTLRVGRTVSVADVEVRDASGPLVAVGRGCYASPEPEPLRARRQAACPVSDRRPAPA